MEKHTRVVLSAYGIGVPEDLKCEYCLFTGGKNAWEGVDIHHIYSRSLGGDDVIANLMGLCRECHANYGDKKQYRLELQKAHAVYLTSQVFRYLPYSYTHLMI